MVAQAIRGQEYRFRFKWFIFHYLIYANIIWAWKNYFLADTNFSLSFFSIISTGFLMAGIVTIIEEARIKGTSIYWMSIILGVLLIAGNIESVQNLSLHLATTPVTTYYESSKSNQSYDISRPSDTVELPNYHGDCPIPITEAVTAVSVGSEGSYPTSTVMMIENLMNNSIWRIEANVRSCYKGKYNGQRPNWLYCDDMIVSRWETTNTGTIKYRWYTAVIAQWRPKEGDPLAWRYVFDSFSCENGKKVSVDKEKTAYYVHVSRDGTEIKIEY